MIRFLAALVLAVSFTAFAEPHGGGDKGTKPAPANKGDRDRTEKPLFEPYPAIIDCDDVDKDYKDIRDAWDKRTKNAEKIVRDMRQKRNEQLIANSSLPDIDTMKRILSNGIKLMRQGDVRPERKEAEDKAYYAKFSLLAEAAPTAPAVIKKAVALLNSDSFQEREVATKFLKELGPAALRETALTDAMKNGSLEQANRANEIVSVLFAPTLVKLINPETQDRESEVAAHQFVHNKAFNETDWDSIFALAKAAMRDRSKPRAVAMKDAFVQIISRKFQTKSDSKEISVRTDTEHSKYDEVRGQSRIMLQMNHEDYSRTDFGRPIISCFDFGNNYWSQTDVIFLPSGDVIFEARRTNVAPVTRKFPLDNTVRVEPPNLKQPTISQFKKHLVDLVSGELEAKSPSPPTSLDLAWLAAWKEVREKSGLDNTDGEVATSVAPLLKALDDEDFRVRYLAREQLEFYGPALEKNPALVEAAKYPGGVVSDAANEHQE